MKDLLKRLHRDNAGAISVETILILAVIAIPIIVIILIWGKKIIGWFNDQGTQLESDRIQ
jgi:Flp pilus assembly pilin Flp